jgi:hypothetical protein
MSYPRPDYDDSLDRVFSFFVKLVMVILAGWFVGWAFVAVFL